MSAPRNQAVTRGIVLKRTDYGEADRIITLLTPDQGKLRLMARGVRRVKSKLAGGIELFSISHITFMRGRGEIGTLLSSRLDKHYGHIVGRIERVQLGYELIKMVDKNTEDEPEADYFELLQEALQALDDLSIPDELIRAWFTAQLLKISGHMPNLQADSGGLPLEPRQKYNFDSDAMALTPHPAGRLGASHIKFLRLLFSASLPAALSKIAGSADLTQALQPALAAMRATYIRV